MIAYRRYRLQGGCYFFTVALAERRGQLLTENIEGLRAAFQEVKQAHPVKAVSDPSVTQLFGEATAMLNDIPTNLGAPSPPPREARGRLRKACL